MIIWVIGRCYPLPENGMQGSFELEQAKMLARYGNDVHFLACSLHPVKKIKGTGLQSWDDEGVKVTVLSAFFAPRIYPVYFANGRNKQWKRLFDEVEEKSGLPDVIHVHYPAMLMMADALKGYHTKGVRVVATEHWTKVLGKKLDSIELKEYKKYNSVLDKMICVGTPLARSVKELTGINGVVVPNVVSNAFRPTEDKHDGFRFVAVGRLVPSKQFDKIIEAFSDCYPEKKDISLWIIGGGRETDKLKKIIIERKIGDRVKLLGVQTRERTAALVAECDSLICYSSLETFGVPVIEAWACGIPVISTTALAVLEHWDNRMGVEVDYKDQEQLKNAIQHIVNNREKYDKTYMTDYVKQHFSEEAIYGSLIDIYSGRKG